MASGDPNWEDEGERAADGSAAEVDGQKEPTTPRTQGDSHWRGADLYAAK